MDRRVGRKIEAASVQDGAGVKIRRGIGTELFKNLDPFLMLDHFGTDNPDDYIGGFPDHPHRGFVTVTYMIDGRMQHQDSMGNTGDLGPGDVQWMKAASGIIHSEMPLQKDGAMRGFQLWLNLPATEKMSSPAYQEIPARDIPAVEFTGGQVKVISGSFSGASGPVTDGNTNVMLLHADLQSGGKFESPVPVDANVAMYVFEGSVSIADTAVQVHEVVSFEDGDHVAMLAGAEGAQVLLFAGMPIGESIVQHGPFVMNTNEEIKTAFEDYRRGRLVQERAAFNE